MEATMGSEELRQKMMCLCLKVLELLKFHLSLADTAVREQQ